MNAKRILALVLGLLMLVPMVMSVGAYSPAYSDLQDNTESTSNLILSGSSLNFDKVGTLTNQAAGTKTCTYNITDESGALHLNNTSTTANQAYNTGNKGGSAAGSVGTWASTANGMTFDLYAKFANLPKLASGMTDTGVVSGNPSNLYFSGLVFNLCSSEKYMADSSKANNELNAVFAYYDNKTLGTNTVLILPYGNRNAFASASAVVYYFNSSKTSYDRYTLSFDPVAKTTQFFINGVAQKANGNGSTTFNQVALCYRASATVNFLNINLNNAQGCVSANNGTYKANVYIDQLDVYPDALIPNPAKPAYFMSDPADVKPSNAQLDKAIAMYLDYEMYAEEYYDPDFWSAFENWIGYCEEIVENGTQAQLEAACTGTSGNWFINRMTWLSTAGATATTGGSAATVAGTGEVIPANTPILLGTDRIWISHSSYDGKTDAYAWSNASVILTRPGMSMSEYLAFNNSSYSIAYSTTWRAYVCEPTKAAGIYQIVEMGYNKDAIVPEGGFIVAMHVDGIANGSVYTSTYPSDIFGNRNERASGVAGLAVGDYVKLEGVTIHADQAATLDTEGTWICYHDPRVGTSGYPATELARAELQGTALHAEVFDGFRTYAYMKEVSASSVSTNGNITLTTEGTGSVTAKIGSSSVSTPASFTAPIGSTITVKASGTNFLYWKNANNSAILSQDAEFTFNFGVTSLDLVAVFATGTTSTTYTVTFKDSLTGKIYGTTKVTSGETVTSGIPSAGAMYGYTFRGWYAENNLNNAIATYKVTGNTTFYARYKSDDAAYFNLTVKDGSSTSTLRVRYAKIAVVTATSSSFSYWNLDGNFYSSAKTVQVSMPNRDCTLTAVNNGAYQAAPTVSTVANFVDNNGNLLSTFATDVPAGYTLVERGILMTRKASASDLVVDTLVNTVTKGISTAAADQNVFGFVKAGITSKAGTWLVRGYLAYVLPGDDEVTIVYTDITTLKVQGTGEYIPPTKLTVMTHNMRNGNTSYSSIASNAAAEGAQVIGIQESGYLYFNSLKSAMSNQGYSAIQGSGRGGGFNSEYNPIFYKADDFNLLGSGTFWLSDTPNTESKISALKYYRICTWGQFEDKDNGEVFFYFNTHLCATPTTEGLGSSGNTEPYRFQQVKVLLNQIVSITNGKAGADHIILGGDLNTTDTNGVFKYISGSAAYSGESNTITGTKLRFAKLVADTTTPNADGNYYTMQENGVPKYSFDHIFVSIEGIRVNEFKVVSNAANSDHQPVVCKLTIK